MMMNQWLRVDCATMYHPLDLPASLFPGTAAANLSTLRQMRLKQAFPGINKIGRLFPKGKSGKIYGHCKADILRPVLRCPLPGRYARHLPCLRPMCLFSLRYYSSFFQLRLVAVFHAGSRFCTWRGIGDTLIATAQVDHRAGDKVRADRCRDHQEHGHQDFMQADSGLNGAEMQH